MDTENLTEFSGVVGRVLRSAFSWRTLATGIALGLLLLVVMFVLGMAGAPNAAVFVVEILMAAAMARFALNGLYGEWDGTIFSSAGGSWGHVLAVAGRHLFATLVWLVPLFFLGLSSMGTPQTMVTGGGDLLVFSVYMFLSTLTPPLFLIAAVSAESFAEFLSADHWRRLFRGRTTDLFMVYAAYTGALGMAVVLAFPLVIGAFAVAWPLALFVGGMVFAFLFGLMVSLLGRLCGFYAFGDSTTDPSTLAVPSGTGPGAPAGAAAGSMAAGAAALSASPVHAALEGGVIGGRPVLGEAREPLAEAARKFASDPEGALAVLQDVNERFAPHPQILHALCMFSHRAGKAKEAAEIAREALPVCLQRGALPLAEEILRTLWNERKSLGLERDQNLQLAAALLRSGQLAYAANLYSMVLQEDAHDARALKGVMQAAEKFLKERNQPVDARKLYEYLLRVAPDSPLAEYIQQGLEAARKAAGAAETAGQ